jgi:hypothetical protein
MDFSLIVNRLVTGVETGRDSLVVSACFGSGAATVWAGAEVITFSFRNRRPGGLLSETAAWQPQNETGLVNVIRSQIWEQGAGFFDDGSQVQEGQTLTRTRRGV